MSNELISVANPFPFQYNAKAVPESAQRASTGQLFLYDAVIALLGKSLFREAANSGCHRASKQLLCSWQEPLR